MSSTDASDPFPFCGSCGTWHAPHRHVSIEERELMSADAKIKELQDKLSAALKNAEKFEIALNDEISWRRAEEAKADALTSRLDAIRNYCSAQIGSDESAWIGGRREMAEDVLRLLLNSEDSVCLGTFSYQTPEPLNPLCAREEDAIQSDTGVEKPLLIECSKCGKELPSVDAWHTDNESMCDGCVGAEIHGYDANGSPITGAPITDEDRKWAADEIRKLRESE